MPTYLKAAIRDFANGKHNRVVGAGWLGRQTRYGKSLLISRHGLLTGATGAIEIDEQNRPGSAQIEPEISVTKLSF